MVVGEGGRNPPMRGPRPSLRVKLCYILHPQISDMLLVAFFTQGLFQALAIVHIRSSLPTTLIIDDIY